MNDALITDIGCFVSSHLFTADGPQRARLPTPPTVVVVVVVFTLKTVLTSIQHPSLSYS